MLKINDLYVKRGKKPILKGIDLSIKSGETHAIIGQNGSGKSTLANAIMSNPNYKKYKGTITFNNKNITNLEADEVAKEGVFMAFQYPQEVAGVSLKQFIKLCYEEMHGKISFVKFNEMVNHTCKQLNLNPSLLERGLNEGFSGGEKKKSEILQMYILKPKLIVLDETDSGLDVSSLRLVASQINELKKEHNPTVLIITHYSRILEYIKPSKVHVVSDGKIIKTGKFDLVKRIEERGFEHLGEKK